MFQKFIGVLGDNVKVRGGQIHPRNIDTTFQGKSLSLKCFRKGLGECKCEVYPVFMSFTRHSLWLLLVTAP